MFGKMVAYSLILLLVLVSGIKNDERVTKDVSPCICSICSSNYKEITCVGARADEITQFVNQTISSQYINYVTILDFFEEDIPADLFSAKLVGYIDVACNSSKPFLRVDPNAFRSSRNYLSGLHLRDCNLQLMNSKFLDGFDNLTYLEFSSVSNLQQAFVSLPTLPKLFQMKMTGCSNDFDGSLIVYDTSTLSPSLANFMTVSNYWDEVTVGWTFGWLSKRNSTDNLRNIVMSSNSMSRIPPEMASIQMFRDFQTVLNDVPMRIHSGSFYFGCPPLWAESSRYFSLKMDNIVDIQPGAFQGNFSCWPTSIHLEGNHLTRLDEDVFYPVFEQFATTSHFSYIDVSENPFSCDGYELCQLAWLVRDRPQWLQTYVMGATCSNGTTFRSLNPEGFQHCP